MSNEVVTGLESLSTTLEIDYAGWPSPFDDDGVQYAWDSTSLGMLKRCPRYYQLSMVLNWQPKEKSYHLIFGILYHSAIELYLKTKVSMKLEEAGHSVEHMHETSVRVAIRQTMIDSFGYQPGLKKGVPDNAKTREHLIRTLVWYFEHYRDHPATTLILSNGRPAVELSFRFEIGHDLMLSGHLDHIVKFGDGNYVEDHKTTASTVTGASAKHFFKGFNPDNQMTLYSTAAMIAFNTPVKGVIIDAAQIAVGFSAFGRDLTHRSEAQIREFLHGVVAYRQMAESYTRSGFWPMNETACGNYGGCQFRDICSKSPSVRERFLRTEFTQDKPWNPLEPR
jgi:hypothetical protein